MTSPARQTHSPRAAVELLPWVLLRKGAPLLRFASLERGRKAFDQMRFNAGAFADAALFGPNGEAWYCQRFRWSEWVRDDDRRKRQRPEDPKEEADA